jgi:carbonic anhydrase
MANGSRERDGFKLPPMTHGRPRGISLAICAAALIAGTAALAVGESTHWTYEGLDGPSRWGSLDKKYQSCARGKAQSPIAISDAIAIKSDLPPIDFHYKSSALKIIDNGHTIQVNYEPGSFITIGPRQYGLVQFHFHRPSEEELNGRRYDMVAHLVHQDGEGRLAVVAVLLTAGRANSLISSLWQHLPKAKGTEIAANVKIDLADLLPPNLAYYSYAGSLTTPPCSEGVTWFVLRDPVSVSADQIARFAELYSMNARPVQPLNARRVRATP